MNTQLTFKQINEILMDIDNLTKHGEVVEKKTKEENNYEYPYFVIHLDESRYGKELYLKAYEYEDSYGDNYKITGVQFVKPQKVVATDFQSL